MAPVGAFSFSFDTIYMKNDHPTEEVWNLLLPKIIKAANL
jgi:hypothetical protein